MNMLLPMELPSSAVASRLASTKWSARPPAVPDGALEALGRQRIVGIAGEVARQEFGGIDDDAGVARFDGAQHFLGAGDDAVAAEHEIGAAGGDADGVNFFRRIGDADVAVHRAALLREAGHVDHAGALAFEMRGHADDGADGDDAGAADAGDDDAVGMIGQRQLRIGQRRPVSGCATLSPFFSLAPCTVTKDGQKPLRQE